MDWEGHLIAQTDDFCNVPTMTCDSDVTQLIWDLNDEQILIEDYGQYFIMNADGTDIQNLGQIAPGGSASWSSLLTHAGTHAGGATYVFSGIGNEFGRELWQVDGKGVSGAPRPAWSPDGNCVAYVVSDGEYQNLYIATADGKFTRQITENMVIGNQPAWSPDSHCGE